MISQVWTLSQLQNLRTMLSEAIADGLTIDRLAAEIDSRLDPIDVGRPAKSIHNTTACPSCGHDHLYRCPQTGALVCGRQCGYSRMGM